MLLAREQSAGGTDLHCLVACPALSDELAALHIPVTLWRGLNHPLGWVQLWRAARQHRNLLHAHDSRSHGALRLVGPRALRSRLVVHRRIDDPPRRRWITRWKYRRGTLICVSKAVDRVMGEFGVPQERRTVLYSAVSPPEVSRVQGLPAAPRAALRLLSIGALVPHKGHEVLIRALGQTRADLTLVILGDGPLRDRLQGLALSLGVGDRVTLRGYEPAAATDLLAGSDLYVQPSLSEGLGTAVLDAMAMELPVVASAVGGLPEIVLQDTGWLVPPGDALALAQTLDRLAETWTDRKRSSGARTRQAAALVQDRHSPAGMLAGVRSIYDGLL
jgi:glycosyltransferase involved in cell wall biosynthesis